MHENRAYRGYFFTNMYLSAVQCGIQAAHCVGRMAREPNIIFSEWIHNHETIILLNGGNCEDLDSLYDQLLSLTNNLHYDGYKPLPVARFCEDKKSLNEATTCVGIILPDSVYNLDVSYTDFWIRNIFGESYEESTACFIQKERDLKALIAKYHLVR